MGIFGFDVGNMLGGFDPLGMATSALSSAWQVDRASDMADHAMNMSAAEAATNRDWQERMSNTAYQRQVADMQAAGINPMLAAMKGGGATTPSGATGTGISAGVQTPELMQGAVSAAQVSNINAQTERARAETNEINERTKTYPVSIDVMRSQIDSTYTNIRKMIEEIGNIGQQTATSAAQQANLQQSTANLKAQLPQIAAMVKQLQAQTTLTYADAKLRGIQGDLTAAQWGETNQRIAANLPAIQAALTKAQEFITRMEGPQMQNRAGLHSTPVGALAELLKAFNPLTGIIAVSK